MKPECQTCVRTPLTTDCKRETLDTNSTKAFHSENEKFELEKTNQKLSVQIKENLRIFESLDKQLKMKDQRIHKNEKEIE
jgi:N-acetylneuraminic acid mutarotase